MGGYQNEPAAGVSERPLWRLNPPLFQSVLHEKKRIDHRVAGNENSLAPGALAPQIIGRLFGSREVQVTQTAGQAAVHLLRERTIAVVRPQPCLHVSNWNFLVEGGQSRGKRCGRVALHHNDVRLHFRQNPAHRRQDARCDLVETLPGPHQVQVMIGFDLERPQHLVEHRAVLGGDTGAHLEAIGQASKMPDQNTKLDRFRAGTEDH